MATARRGRRSAGRYSAAVAPWAMVWLRRMRAPKPAFARRRNADGPPPGGGLCGGGLRAGGIALAEAGCGPAKGLIAAETPASCDTSKTAGAIGGGGTARRHWHRHGPLRRGTTEGAQATGCGDDARRAEACRGKSGSDSRTRAELGSACDQAVGDAGTENRKTEQREACQDQRERVVDGGRIVEAAVNWPKIV